MRVLDEVRPAWNDDGWTELVLGVRSVCERARALVAALPAPAPDDPDPADDDALDLLVGAVVVAARAGRLVDAMLAAPPEAAVDPEPADAAPVDLLR